MTALSTNIITIGDRQYVIKHVTHHADDTRKYWTITTVSGFKFKYIHYNDPTKDDEALNINQHKPLTGKAFRDLQIYVQHYV